MSPSSGERPGARRSAWTIGLEHAVRQLRSDPTVVTSISIVVLVASLVIIMAPGLLAAVSAEALERDLAAASATDRHLEVTRLTRFGVRGGQEAFVPVERAQSRFHEEQIPASIQAAITRELYVVKSAQFAAAAYPGTEPRPLPTFLRLSYQEDVEQNISVVAGRLPAPAAPIGLRAGPDCPPVEVGEDPAVVDRSGLRDLNGDGEIECDVEAVSRFEIALSTETLQALDMEIGERLLLTPDQADQQFHPVPGARLEYRLIVEVSGAFEIDAPDSAYWFDDPSLARPRLRSNADFTEFFATGLVAREVHSDLRRDLGLALWDYSFRYLIDPAAITPESVPQLLAGLESLETNFDPLESALSGGFRMRTGLSDLLGDYLERRDEALAMLRLAFAGLFLVAIAVASLLAVLAAERQGRSIVQLRNRGASKVQLVMTRVLQGLLLSVPAVTVAFLASTSLLPTPGGSAGWAAVAVIAVATGLVLLAGANRIFSNLGRLQRDPGALRTTSARRIVLELFVVGLAIAALVVLRRRGRTDGTSPDALLVVGPVLLSVAVAIITLRVYPLVIKPIAWVGARLRGAVVFIGFRRILQLAPAARLPLTVVLVAAAIGIFASVVHSSIVEGQERSTWHTAGAAHRITGIEPGRTLPRLDLDSTPSIAATATATLFPAARVGNAPLDAPRIVDVLVIDGAAYREVAAGTRADPLLPSWFFTATGGTELGTPERPVPVIATGGRPAFGPPESGMVFGVGLRSAQPLVQVREVRATFPTVATDGITLIAPLDAMEKATGLSLLPTEVYIRAPEAARESLAEVVGGPVPLARLLSQQALLEEVRGGTFASAVLTALRVTFVGSLLLGLLAAVASAALMADVRRRDLGYLRTLGLGRDQSLVLTFIEQMPPLLIAGLVGAFLGAGIVVLLEPAVGIESFTGSAVAATVSIDRVTIAAATAILVGVVALGMALAGYRDARRHMDQILRVGDE